MPVRQTELGRAIGMQRANVVQVLDELIGRGFVTRHPARDDGRCKVVSLTKKGIKFTDTLLERHGKLEQNVAEGLGKRELAKLRQLLKEFRKLDPNPGLD